MFNNAGLSLADIAAVSGGRNNDNNGFMNGDGWWAIILFAMIFGWGRNGFGNNNGGDNNQPSVVVVPTAGGYGGGFGSSMGFTDAAVQRGFDNAAVTNKLNGLENGLCSLGYDQLAQMKDLGTTVQQVGFGLQQTACQGQISNMQSFNAVMQAISECCCNTREAIAQVRFDMAQEGCQTRQAINTAARDIIENNNNQFNQLRAELTAWKMEQKDETIAQLRQELLMRTNSDNICNQNATLLAYMQQISAQERADAMSCPRPTYDVYPPQYVNQCNRNNNCCNNVSFN